MPAQCLIRKLPRAQIDKIVADSKSASRLEISTVDGLVLVAAKQAYPADPAANAVIQAIADADSALILKEAAELRALEAADKPSRATS